MLSRRLDQPWVVIGYRIRRVALGASRALGEQVRLDDVMAALTEAGEVAYGGETLKSSAYEDRHLHATLTLGYHL
jgi:hypothetical protein